MISVWVSDSCNNFCIAKNNISQQTQTKKNKCTDYLSTLSYSFLLETILFLLYILYYFFLYYFYYRASDFNEALDEID